MSKINWRQVPALALAAFFVVGSLSNIFAFGSIYEEYLRWGYPHWFHFVTGSLELTTAVLLAQARTRLWGSALGCTVMLAALATVTLHGEYGHGCCRSSRRHYQPSSAGSPGGSGSQPFGTTITGSAGFNSESWGGAQASRGRRDGPPYASRDRADIRRQVPTGHPTSSRR